MIDYNCYICLDCGKRFDRPLYDDMRYAYLGREYCPQCQSEDIREEYDESYDDYINQLFEEERERYAV